MFISGIEKDLNAPIHVIQMKNAPGFHDPILPVPYFTALLIAFEPSLRISYIPLIIKCRSWHASENFVEVCDTKIMTFAARTFVLYVLQPDTRKLARRVQVSARHVDLGMYRFGVSQHYLTQESSE